MFKYQISEDLGRIIKILNKKDRKRSLILFKKIQEIIDNDAKTIERYKNLKYELNEFKRAHIDKSFVLIFKVDKEKNFILFERLEHHDRVYK